MSWYMLRAKESNGFVAKRTMKYCYAYMMAAQGFAIIKDGRIILDFFEAADAFMESHKMFL